MERLINRPTLDGSVIIFVPAATADMHYLEKYPSLSAFPYSDARNHFTKTNFDY